MTRVKSTNESGIGPTVTVIAATFLFACAGGPAPIAADMPADDSPDASSDPSPADLPGDRFIEVVPAVDPGAPADADLDARTDADIDAGADADPDAVDAPAGQQSCPGFWTCVGHACEGVPDTACIATCRADLSPFAQQQVDWALDCFDDSGCLDAPTIDAFNDCIEAACLEEYMTCFSDGPEYPCRDLVSCLDACDGTACDAGCHDGQPPWTEATWAAWQDCVATACPECATDAAGDACQACEAKTAADACPDLHASCHPWGIAGCGATLACLEACATSECSEGCVSEATLDARALLKAVFDCLNIACPDGADPAWPACADAAYDGPCAAARLACTNDG